MKKIFNVLLTILRLLMLLGAAGLTFYGMLVMYDRLGKPVTDAIPTMLPFALLLIAFMVNISGKQKQINSNLYYNVSSVIVLGAIIFIGYRAKFDTNMALYYQYGINFNPSYFADNLAIIKSLLYCLFAANILLMFTRKNVKKKEVIVETLEPKEELKHEENKVSYELNKVPSPGKEIVIE